jgi:oxaloacetate decarboxylase gamma subunit
MLVKGVFLAAICGFFRLECRAYRRTPERPTMPDGCSTKPTRGGSAMNPLLDTTALMVGLELMILGMGMVFVFLTVLIMALRVMSAIAARFPDPAPECSAPAASGAITPTSNVKLVAVIGAAIARYRSAQNS